MVSRGLVTRFFAFLALSASTLAWGINGVDYNYLTQDPDDFRVTAAGRSDSNTSTDITILTTFEFDDDVQGLITLTVVAVDSFAFDAIDLTSVSIGNAVVTIGFGAFFDNSITSLTIGNAVESIENIAFSTNQLTTVVIPNSVTNIGQGAFDNNNLNAITIGSSVTDIGGGAFRDNALTSLTIPDSVINIDAGAFSTNALTIAYFVGNYGADFAGSMLSGNPQLSTILACDTATGWDGITFSNGSYEVPVIKSSGACDGNENGVVDRLDLEFDLDSPNPGTATVLRRVPSNTSLDVSIPGSIFDSGATLDVTHIGNFAFFNNALASVMIPDSVTNIGTNAFQGNNLTSVTIPNSVTDIGAGAFQNNNLTSLTLPNSVTNIGDSAFFNNPLTSLTIPEGVTVIGGSAFRNTSLVSVSIPASTATIGPFAFTSLLLKKVYFVGNYSADIVGTALDGSLALSDIVACSTATGWDGISFTIQTEAVPVIKSISACDVNDNGVADRFDLEFDLDTPNPGTATVLGRALANTSLDIAIPRSIVESGEMLDVTHIGSSAFQSNNLTSVTIPDSVTDIGNNAFQLNNLTSVTIPDNVTDIGSGAFGFNNLTSVALPNSVRNIGNGAFQQNALTSLTIPDSVTDIGVGAFDGSALVTVTIPANTTRIGEFAFINNPLGTVYFLGNHTVDFDVAAFAQNAQLTEILACDNATGWEGITFNKGSGGVPVPVSVITSNEACDDDGDGVVNRLEPQIAPQPPTIDRSDYGDGFLELFVSVPEGDLAITGFSASCTDGSNIYMGSGSSSPITVAGLTNGVAYTCSVTATNVAGTSNVSASTAPITPEEPIEQGLPIWLLYQTTK